MISILFSNIQLIFLALFLSISTVIFSQTTTADIFYDNLIEEYDLAGLSVAVIKDGKVALHHHGVTSMDTKDSIRQHTVFGAASLSKPVFAYAVLKLIAQGKIDLDRSLYQYLENEDLKGDDRYQQITARMILSHSSGLPNWRNGKLKLMHAPGSQFQYSGEGYMYLAKVVEHLLQKPINEVMQELVFTPLDMKNSSFVWEDRFATNFASPHDYTNSPKPNWRPEKPVIASSLQTTAEDYAKFILAILNLEQDIQDEIRTVYSKISDVLFWGLGWGIQKSAKGEYLWQWGDNGTFKSFAMIYPDIKEGMVFFANSYKGLRILPKVVGYLFEDTIPSFHTLERTLLVRADEKLMLSILKNGYENGIKDFIVSNDTEIDTVMITERQLAFVSMQLKWRKRYSEEKRLLKIIAHTFPTSFNAQKNYATHCVRHGDNQEGIQYYKKALKIAPGNEAIPNTLHLLTSKELSGNVTFVFTDYLWGSSVSVSGSFNDWSYSSIPLLKKNGVWTTTIQLPTGEYAYQFIVDGYPMLDPNNRETVVENGQVYSLLKVP
ncbi:MAG: serine hydrolase [Bacteroidota bacterium]